MMMEDHNMKHQGYDVDIDIQILGDEKELKGSHHTNNDTLIDKLDTFKFLTVLLVEFDDSTRSIITALLRKTGYRVVSVPDGLKAWETLKARPHNIDLVLAEVELPSICGFSLLTMIMEDHFCRNIPVIMMSPSDAVNLVFKCLLRGAVDFLVKPVRKNELRNLWQHVWRRHSVVSSNEISHQNGIPSQQKPQAIDETSSTKHSTYCIASINENSDYSAKGADAQSSCTKSHMQDDTAGIENMPTLSELKFMTVPSVDSMKTRRVGDSSNVDDVLLMNENEVEDKSIRLVCAKAPCNQSNYSRALISEKEQANAKSLTKGNNPESETQQEDTTIQINRLDGNDEQLKPSREAMDLIGSIDNHLQEYTTHFQQVLCDTLNIYFDPNNTRNKCSSNPQLELSLRSSEFCDNEIKGVLEVQGQELKHSNASAFSRYNQQTVQPPVCTESEGVSLLVTCNHQSDHAFSHIAEIPQHGVISFPFPVRSRGVDSLQSNCATQQSNPETRDYQQSTCKSTNLTKHEQRHSVQTLDDFTHISVTTTQTVTSSLCNSSSSTINSSGCGSVCDGSNGNETAATTFEATTRGEIDIGVFMHDGVKGTDSYCSSQREAALTKFRMKRKDRCFEKKVRYQSRKKLAEERPRVKGQFVRQIPS